MNMNSLNFKRYNIKRNNCLVNGKILGRELEDPRGDSHFLSEYEIQLLSQPLSLTAEILI